MFEAMFTSSWLHLMFYLFHSEVGKKQLFINIKIPLNFLINYLDKSEKKDVVEKTKSITSF